MRQRDSDRTLITQLQAQTTEVRSAQQQQGKETISTPPGTVLGFPTLLSQ